MNLVSYSWVAKCGFKLKKGCLKKVGKLKDGVITIKVVFFVYMGGRME